MTSTELATTYTGCCASHRPGEPPVGGMAPCCDPDDCGPCCERCPTCPSLRRQRANRRNPADAGLRIIYGALRRGEDEVAPVVLDIAPRYSSRPELVVRAREVLGSLIEADLLVGRARPQPGDRVLNGGEPGVLVRCPECSGDGTLHVPDVMPAAVAPTPDQEPTPRKGGTCYCAARGANGHPQHYEPG